MSLYAVLMPFDWKINGNLVKEISRVTSRKLNRMIFDKKGIRMYLF